MLRFLAIFVGLWFSMGSYAETTSMMSLLDNRFRVDPTIKQITFLIYRAKPSRPVVLVRPDGVKYYANRHPDNVRWYQESSMDIVSVDQPMPGPWQAIGKVTPKNNIKLISNLKLTTDKLPLRLYHGEDIKFTARLSSNGKPLKLRDFLDRVKLKVTFTKYVENEKQLIKEARPKPYVIGDFADDGRGLDEKPGDGVFTVRLRVFPDPGKYRARITSGNGVFLRAQEQEVLVYPEPITTTFIHSRVKGKPHHMIFTGQAGTIKPGSVVAHIEHRDNYDNVIYAEGQAAPDGLTVNLTVPYNGEVGKYRWSGHVYATEQESSRPLSFVIPEHTYSVVDDVNIEKTRQMQAQELKEKKERAREAALLKERESERMWGIIYIIIGNLVVVILGLIGWFIYRKFKARSELQPKMQFDMPKKK
jgi:uncharacterized protein (TIGR03503 family)